MTFRASLLLALLLAAVPARPATVPQAELVSRMPRFETGFTPAERLRLQRRA